MGKNKLRIAISCGDINGIGLEVALKALSDSRMLELCTPVIYANEGTVKYHMKKADLELPLNKCTDSNKLHGSKINIVNVFDSQIRTEFGNPTKNSGEAAFKSLKAAVEDLASNKVDALVTAPIDKSAIQSDEFQFPGHTEFLANYANEENPLMILVHEKLRVALVTGHLPLKEVSSALSQDQITRKIDVFAKSLQFDFGIKQPRIAVLGLNPHNGDNGLMGTEEKDIIAPAISAAKTQGHLVFGPYPADGFFGSSNRHQFDGILAMYHDQGLAPFKALAFEGVNFTAGLPIVRTSPDHGTAFDIAGKGMADPQSFRNAIFLAKDIYTCRIEERELRSNQLATSSK